MKEELQITTNLATEASNAEEALDRRLHSDFNENSAVSPMTDDNQMELAGLLSELAPQEEKSETTTKGADNVDQANRVQDEEKHESSTSSESGDIFSLSPNDTPYALEIDYVTNMGVFYNQFTQRTSLRNEGDLDERIFNTIYMVAKKDFPGISKPLLDTIVNSEFLPKFNPVKELFESFETMKADNSLNRFLSCLTHEEGIDRQFIDELITKWLMQFPAMAIDDVYPRLALVMIGPSHIGKTTFLRNLLPDELNKLYVENELNQGKDSNFLLSENLLVNIDEFGGLAIGDPRLFKNIQSSESFKERRPYGTYSQDLIRRAIISGTSNSMEILNDHSTENTRVIPCLLRDIDREKYNSVDKRLLMAEITQLYLNGGPDCIRLTLEERRKLGEYSKGFEVHSIEHDVIGEYLAPGDDFKSTKDILDYLNRHLGKAPSMKVLRGVLTELGITRTRKYINKVQFRGYLVKFLK